MLYSTLTNLKNSLLDNLRRILSDPDEHLPSVPEPFIPDPANLETRYPITQDDKVSAGEKLCEKAAKKLHGPDANPSILGDPISLKAESSDSVPTPDPNENKAEMGYAGKKHGGAAGGGERLQEKAERKLDGPNANPSQLGDPISLKNETSSNVPTPGEQVARRRSKL